MSKIKNVSRFFFVLIILFEIANYLRVFHFTVDFTWFGLIVTSLFVFGALEIGNKVITKKLHTPLPHIVWFIAFLTVAVDAAGDIAHWYSRWLWYDQVAHALGGAITVLVIFVIFTIVARSHAWQHPTHLSYSYAIGLATVLGVLYEIEEYLEDYFGFTNRLGDGRDTANDLLLNLVGSIAALTVIALTRYVRKRSLR